MGNQKPNKGNPRRKAIRNDNKEAIDGGSLRERVASRQDDPALTRTPSIKATAHGKDPAAGSSERTAAAVKPPPDLPAVAAGAPTQPDEATKELLGQVRRQQDLRIKQEFAEAEELEQRAKEISKRAKARRKLRAGVEKHRDYVTRLAPELGYDPNRPITPIPPLGDGRREVELITIQDQHAYVRIEHDENQNRHEYVVIEPPLTKIEDEVREFIRDTLVRTLEGRRSNGDMPPESYLYEAIERAILDHNILVDNVSQQRIAYHLLRDLLGFGPIDVLMHDPMIEDISCDGPGIPIYLFHRQYESLKTTVVFPKEIDLDSFVIRLAQRSGKHISIADPILDATLSDGSRLQATLSREVTTRGSSFTIRKFRSDPLTPPDLIRIGTLSPAMAAYFWFVMEEGQSLIYAGGTASGKTTTLNAVSTFIPPDKKIVSIEDTREINLNHENWVAGVTRTGFGGELVGGRAAGVIDMYKLLEAALRQRPEYLLVGEVRGPEAMTLFQAMATGHATYSTLHADSVSSAVYRLENPPINVPRIMIQTLDAISIQMQVRIDGRMQRRIKEVVEIVGIDPETGDLLSNTVFRWVPSQDRYEYTGKSHIFEQIQEHRSLSLTQVEQEWENRTRVLQWLTEKGVRHIRDVSAIVAEYYLRPANVLAKAKAKTPTGSPDEVIAHGP